MSEPLSNAEWFAAFKGAAAFKDAAHRVAARPTAAYYVRLGRLLRAMERYEPGGAFTCRAIQVAATWRSHFAWHLANALGWRTPSRTERSWP